MFDSIYLSNLLLMKRGCTVSCDVLCRPSAVTCLYGAVPHLSPFVLLDISSLDQSWYLVVHKENMDFLEFIVSAQSYCNRNSRTNSDAFLCIGGSSTIILCSQRLAPSMFVYRQFFTENFSEWNLLFMLSKGSRWQHVSDLLHGVITIYIFRSQTNSIPILFFIVQLC